MKSKTKICIALLAFCLLVGPLVGPLGALTAAAAPPEGIVTPVYLEGQEVLAGECLRMDGVTYVPLRKFCALFGATDISWNGWTKTATVSSKSLLMTVRTGNLYIEANGRYFYTVRAVCNRSGSLYVPIRPLARAFALELRWDAAANAVSLSRTGRSAAAPADYDADTLYWLSRIISAEARGECLEGQIAVGNVVYNRVASAEFPNTVWGVIFDRKYGTQFSPVSFGTIYDTPSASAVIAAKICMEGYSFSDKALYFVNPRLATSTWIQRARPYLFTIGNHQFYA